MQSQSPRSELFYAISRGIAKTKSRSRSFSLKPGVGAGAGVQPKGSSMRVSALNQEQEPVGVSKTRSTYVEVASTENINR